MEKNIKSRLLRWLLAVLAVIMIPFLTNAPWTARDYLFAFVVLFGSASIYELSVKNIKDSQKRFAVGLALIILVVLIWAWAVA